MYDLRHDTQPFYPYLSFDEKDCLEEYQVTPSPSSLPPVPSLFSRINLVGESPTQIVHYTTRHVFHEPPWVHFLVNQDKFHPLNSFF